MGLHIAIPVQYGKKKHKSTCKKKYFSLEFYQHFESRLAI